MPEIIDILKLLIENPTSFTFLLVIFIVPWATVFYMSMKLFKTVGHCSMCNHEFSELQKDIREILKALLRRINGGP